MSQTDAASRVKSFIAENFLFTSDGFPFSDSASLIEGNVIDSRGILEFILFLEEEFGIKVADDEIVPENLDCINSIVAYIGSKRSQAAA